MCVVSRSVVVGGDRKFCIFLGGCCVDVGVIICADLF